MAKLLAPLLILFAFTAAAQEIRKSPHKDTIPFIFIGGSTGINNFSGMLGVNISVKASELFFLRVGYGLGGWGRKFSAGFKYELKATNSWGFGLGYSSCSGRSDYKPSLETLDSNKTVTRPVEIQLLRASTINFTASYKWIFKHKNNFYIDLGYAARVETDPYRVKDGSVLTKTSKAALHTLQPGGLIIGIGLLFGVQ